MLIYQALYRYESTNFPYFLNWEELPLINGGLQILPEKYNVMQCHEFIPTVAMSGTEHKQK